MLNKYVIVKKLKYFGFTFSGILFLFSIIQYSGLIELTKIKNVQIHGNRFIDSGKIITQKKVKIKKNETAKSLSKKILIEEHKLYPEAINKIFNL